MIAAFSRRRTSSLSIVFLLAITIIVVYFLPRTPSVVHTPVAVAPLDLTARLDQPLSATIRRGILVYYPADKEHLFLPELLWLYRSWLEMMKFEPQSWRTDLLVYTDKFTSNLQNLGCVFNQIRVDDASLPVCRIFIYQSVSLRVAGNTISGTESHPHQQFDEERSQLMVQHLRTYSYVDSVNIVAEYYPSFAMYDYILRTDMDVFVTTNFGRFVPVNKTLLVGQGGYSAEFNTNRLRRVASNMGWAYANITNIGSTWYGPPYEAQRVANMTVTAMIHLAMNEFTKIEKEGRLGVLLWPEWHFGVLSMYGTHMAVNHLVLRENIKIGIARQYLDQFSTRTDPYDIEQSNRLHIHCWHTEHPFSKFSFKDGKYNHIDPSTLLNDTSASGYAMRMALESRLMSFEGLKSALREAKTMLKL